MNLLIIVFCQSKPQVGTLFVPCTKAGKSILKFKRVSRYENDKCFVWP